MDPNANLTRQLELSKRLIACSDSSDCTQCMADGFELAELVESLNGWISKGGFLPEQWKSGKMTNYV